MFSRLVLAQAIIRINGRDKKCIFKDIKLNLLYNKEKGDLREKVKVKLVSATGYGT